MTTSFDGRTALVTGSTSGIGRATAGALAARGAYVIVSGRDGSRGEQAVKALRTSGAAADFVTADLGTSTGARSLAERALQGPSGVRVIAVSPG